MQPSQRNSEIKHLELGIYEERGTTQLKEGRNH